MMTRERAHTTNGIKIELGEQHRPGTYPQECTSSASLVRPQDGGWREGGDHPKEWCLVEAVNEAGVEYEAQVKGGLDTAKTSLLATQCTSRYNVADDVKC